MSDEISTQLVDKAQVAITALSTKLGVAGEYVMEAAIRYEIASAVACMISAIFLIALFIKLLKFFTPKLEGSQEYDTVRLLGGGLLLASGVAAFIVTLVAINEGIPSLVAPQFAVIKTLLGALK